MMVLVVYFKIHKYSFHAFKGQNLRYQYGTEDVLHR